MTKKDKLEQFDRVYAERETLGLALYDIVNGLFAEKYIYSAEWIRQNITGDYDGPSYTIEMSWRGNPIFMVTITEPRTLKRSTPRKSVHVFRETDIEAMRSAAQDGAFFERIVLLGRNELINLHNAKQAAEIPSSYDYDSDGEPRRHGNNP